MLSIRSKNLMEYAVRMLFVILLGLAVHYAVYVAKGGGGKNAFDFGNPERRRTLLVVVLVVGAAAVVMLPTPAASSVEHKTTKRNDEREKTDPEVVPAKALVPSETTEQPEPAGQQPSVPSTESVMMPSPVELVAKDVPASPRKTAVAVPAMPEKSVRSVKPRPRESPVDEMLERKWRMARKIQHNYIPDLVHDGSYLRLVYDVAISGHPEAQAKLGDYAYRRRTLVEAYYWMKLSCMNGCRDAAPNLKACRDKWKRRGCPPEYENVSSIFTERQSSLGRALIRLDCDVMSKPSLTKIKSMAAAGDAVAVRILGEMTEREDV